MANQVTEITATVSEFIFLSGLDEQKVKNLIGQPGFEIVELSEEEAEANGCDLNYPYKIENVFRYDIKAD